MPTKTETYTLTRTGQRPLEFRGRLLAEADGDIGPSGPSRWHELAVYQTEAGRYVVAITLLTRYQGEHDHHLVVYADDPEAIEAALREYDPCPPGIGYPPGPAYADRQARVTADLRRRYEVLVSDLFARLGPEFVETIG